MKAWVVHDEYEEYATVVFAETRNKAKLEAMRTDTCGDMEYLQIKPRRFREADSQYRGLHEMDWQNSSDRRFLVEHGWACVEIDYEKCASCYASDICDKYQDHIIRRKQMKKVTKSADWLTSGYSDEELLTMKTSAIVAADVDVQLKRIEMSTDQYIDDLIKDFERQRQELVKQHGEDDSFVVCIDTVVIPTIMRIANKNTSCGPLNTEKEE